MPEPALSVRPDLAGVAPYVSPQLPAKYRMNTNETPYPPPVALVEEVAEELKRVALNRYPDRDANRLYDAIASHVSWPREGLWVANGSNEVFLHLFLGFGGPGRSVVLFEPTYSLHTLIPTIASTEVVPLTRADDMSIDLDAARDTLRTRSPELTIVCSPNNPTGMCEPRATVESLLDEAPGLVIVDEAYIEFTDPSKSVRDLLDDHPNLVIVKTFSKAWRLAGVRIGYMLAAPALIDELARVKLPYHLSSVTQIVGAAALRHSTETLSLVRSIAAERDRIASGLEARGLRVYPSDANFVLFEVDDPETVWNGLFERGVLVRHYGGQARLERCLRVTAGLPEETDAFLTALSEVIDG
ncbi:MAG TPA: histidinol-phosphate transaminase [Actinomycetota bacterium]|nr:histidinol-phosphate transaminase [Actinomycetota bacterium]